MVTPQAQESLRRLLLGGLRDTLGNDRAWQVEPAPQAHEHHRFAMLTISHLAFRLVVCLQFAQDDRTRQYVADRLSVRPAAVSDHALGDMICELANQLSGTLKRHLGKHYPHLGLSTPHLLDGTSLPHLFEQNRQFDTHALASTGTHPMFGCSLALQPYETVNFQIEEVGDTDIDHGVLELF